MKLSQLLTTCEFYRISIFIVFCVVTFFLALFSEEEKIVSSLASIVLQSGFESENVSRAEATLLHFVTTTRILSGFAMQIWYDGYKKNPFPLPFFYSIGFQPSSLSIFV